MMQSFKSDRQRMWFLHDPIEDNPSYTWENYRYNYEKTLVASLLSKDINDYEICPWPTRVFNRKLPVDKPDSRYIPKTYDAYLNQIFQMLGDIPLAHEKKSKTLSIAMLMSDTAMYQREDPNETDLTFSSFYGLALPLVKRGIFVDFLTVERLLIDHHAHETTDILIMSYDFLKPINPSFHYVLLRWLVLGKSIIFVGEHSDLYHDVYPIFGFDKHPFQHLLEVLNLDDVKEGIHQVSQGLFGYLKINPKHIANLETDLNRYLGMLEEIHIKMGSTFMNQHYFHVVRGPYEIIAVMDECMSKEPFMMKGNFVDLTSLTFDIKNDICVHVDGIGIYYNLSCAKDGDIIGSTFRVYESKLTEDTLELVVDGRKDLTGHIRLSISHKPASVSEDYTYDEDSKTLLISCQLKGRKTIKICF